MPVDQLVDCDIHNELTPGALHPYLPPRWRAYDETYGGRGDGGAGYPKGAPRAARADAWPPSGLPPGADLEFLREQHLDPYDVRYGVLNCLTTACREQNPGYAAALCRAVNEWQVAEWLEKEPRLRAGIVVPYEDAALAAAEIDRAAAHPGFVQVLLLVRTDEPLGRRRYSADLRGRRAQRPSRRDPLRRRPRPQPAHGVRLALVLRGGPHGHGAGVPGAGGEPGRRGRLRGAPGRCGWC